MCWWYHPQDSPTQTQNWSNPSRGNSCFTHSMALAKFHSKRGEKSALILVRANKFSFESRPAYVPAAAVEGMTEGEEFEIPDGFKLVEWVDYETGEIRKTESGEPLHILVW